jgi:hypothetical protein
MPNSSNFSTSRKPHRMGLQSNSRSEPLKLMEQSSLHNARTLSPPVRSALKQLLGRALSDNEAIGVRAYQPHETPPPDRRRAVAGELRHYFAKIDEKTKDIPASELEEILDEAIRSVRPGYRSTR